MLLSSELQHTVSNIHGRFHIKYPSTYLCLILSEHKFQVTAGTVDVCGALEYLVSTEYYKIQPDCRSEIKQVFILKQSRN
jgi:hypothetical protein